MRNLIRQFIKYPVLGNAILVMLFLFGYFAFSNIKTTFFPDIPSRTVMIAATYPGAAPEEIEEGVTIKIEDKLKGLTGIDRVTSTSSENFASIMVELELGYDANIAVQEIKNAVDQISSFPVGLELLKIYKVEMRDFVVAFAITGDVSLKTLKTEARRIERDLLSIEGISKISLSGFPEEEIEISFREDDLRKYGLTFSEVATAVGNANVKITGGKIKGSREELQIRADNKGYRARELENHVVKSSPDGVIVRLKDVADISDRWSEDPNRSYFNGKPAVLIDVQKTIDEDMFYIAGHVKDYINNFNATHAEIKAEILRDGSQIIQERINILSQNGFIGIILVVLFLSLSLNPRLSFWVALAIPLSFAGMFMIGAAYGLTINVMSLMAMILVIGILVDDGIIIAENIYQHYERGEKPLKAALEGTMEVLPSVISAILTTVVIFSTFFFLEGGLGDRAADIAFVVIATLLISLVEAMFILPAHIAHSKALKTPVNKHGWLERHSERILFWLRDKVYAPVLQFSMRNTLIVIAVATALFFITIGAIRGNVIKTTFFPIIELDNIQVTLEMPAGTRDYITDRILTDMEGRIREMHENYSEKTGEAFIEAISRNIGPATHQGGLRVALLPGETRQLSSMQIQNRLRGAIGRIEDAVVLQVGGRGGHWGMPVSISLKSNNLDQLRQAKEKLKAELRKIDRLKDVNDNDPPGLREIEISLKEKAFSLGLNTNQVMRQVRGGFFGQEAQRIIRGIDEVRIWVRYGQDERATIAQLEDMRIRLNDGREFPLREIADLTTQRGVMSIYHIEGQRVVKVEADIASAKESVPAILEDISNDIMPEIIAQYPDVQFGFEGQSRQNKKTTDAMWEVVPPILILMFIIVVVTFRSFIQALIVFLLLPLSLIGVAWGHFAQGFIISMLSLFGTIALFGIVVNDSLVFVNTMNRNLKQGMEFGKALYQAGISRFRPVLLTSLTTIAGLGPLMFEGSFQAQFLSPMAIAIAYGLLFGTFLTLLLLPALLVLFNRLKVYGFWIFRKQKPAPEYVEPAIREEMFSRES